MCACVGVSVCVWGEGEGNISPTYILPKLIVVCLSLSKSCLNQTPAVHLLLFAIVRLHYIVITHKLLLFDVDYINYVYIAVCLFDDVGCCVLL